MPERECEEWLEHPSQTPEMVLLMGQEANDLFVRKLNHLFVNYSVAGGNEQNEKFYLDLITQASPALATQIIQNIYLNMNMFFVTLFAAMFKIIAQNPAKLEHLVQTSPHLFKLLKLLQDGSVKPFLGDSLQQFCNELKKQNKYYQTISQARKNEINTITAGATSEDIQWLVAYFFKLKEEQHLRKEAEENDYEYDEPSLYYLFKGITLGHLSHDQIPVETFKALKVLEGIPDGVSMMPTAVYGVVRAYDSMLKSLWGPLQTNTKAGAARRREMLKNATENLKICFGESSPESRKAVVEAIKLSKTNLLSKLENYQPYPLLDLIMSLNTPWTEKEIDVLIDYATPENFGYAFIYMADKDLQLKTFEKITKMPKANDLVEFLKLLFTQEETTKYFHPNSLIAEVEKII